MNIHPQAFKKYWLCINMCLLGISSWFQLSEKFLLGNGLPFYYISYQRFQINVQVEASWKLSNGNDISQDSIVDPFSFPFSLLFSLEYKTSLHGYNHHLKSISPVHVSGLKFRSVCPTNQSSSEVWQETRFLTFPNQNSVTTPDPSSSPSLDPASFPLPINQFPSLNSRSWLVVPPSSHQKHCGLTRPLSFTLHSHSSNKYYWGNLPDIPHSSFSLSFHSYHWSLSASHLDYFSDWSLSL